MISAIQTLQPKAIITNRKFRITSVSKDRIHNLSLCRPLSYDPKHKKFRPASSKKKQTVIGRNKTTISDQAGGLKPSISTKLHLYFHHKRQRSKQKSQQSPQCINLQSNQSRVQAINTIFCPKSKTQSLKKQIDSNSNTNIHCVKKHFQSKINHYIFEIRNKKFTLKRQPEDAQAQFWGKVNQSLIIPNNNGEQESRDLREFVNNLITE